MADINKLDILLPNSLQTDYSSTTGQQPSVVEGDSFSDILKTALQALNGENTDVHDTMIAMQKADTSLKMMMEVRNKLLSAYQEVIKTQV